MRNRFEIPNTAKDEAEAFDLQLQERNAKYNKENRFVNGNGTDFVAVKPVRPVCLNTTVSPLVGGKYKPITEAQAKEFAREALAAANYNLVDVWVTARLGETMSVDMGHTRESQAPIDDVIQGHRSAMTDALVAATAPERTGKFSFDAYIWDKRLPVLHLWGQHGTPSFDLTFNRLGENPRWINVVVRLVDKPQDKYAATTVRGAYSLVDDLAYDLVRAMEAVAIRTGACEFQRAD